MSGNDAAAAKGRILVARFGAAQGVRGEIRVKSFTGDPLAVAGYGPLSSDDGALYEILKIRPLKGDLVVASVKGVETRDGAEALTGRALYVAREKLPPPDEDEFYVADLIGLGAVSPEGEPVGRVRNVVNYGAGDILEIEPPGGAVLLVAFTRANVPSLDFAAGRLVVIVPEESE